MEIMDIYGMARKLLEMMDIMELTGESQEELEELHRSGTIPDHLDVAQLALRGTSGAFLAAIIQT